MARTPRPSRGPRARRRLLVVSVAFGLFVLFDIALFGWLIFRSLSEREIERVLLETRREAQTLAGDIAERLEGEGDLYTALAVEQETQTYIDDIPRQRDVVRWVEIHDQEGRLVFRSRTESTEAMEDGRGVLVETPEVALEGEPEFVTERREAEIPLPDVEVPIGDLGTLVVGLSPVELEERIQVLRSQLIRQTTVVAAITVPLLLALYPIVWWLWQRTRRLEEAAAEAERMAYIGTLASGLAHEIRNPLNSLSLNMQLIGEELEGGGGGGSGSGSSSVGRLMSITRSEMSRLERLVTDFLSYARPRSPEREEVTPRELFERVREVVGGQVERRGGRLELEDDSGALVAVDVAQLTQLLLNLVGNALAATEEAGIRPRLLLSARRHGEGHGRVVLEVADNGPGIDEAEQDRIFEVFHSTRKGGTGLGLAIVERIALNHGGEVEVESAAGEGATFRVILPEAEAGAAD